MGDCIETDPLIYLGEPFLRNASFMPQPSYIMSNFIHIYRQKREQRQK